MRLIDKAVKTSNETEEYILRAYCPKDFDFSLDCDNNCKLNHDCLKCWNRTIK